MTKAPASFTDGLHAYNVRQLALRLTKAENDLQALTFGGLDAFLDEHGRTYLLRPAQEHLRRNEARLQALAEDSSRRELAASEAGRAKDRFLAMVSHELRTPLMPALIGVETRQRDERFTEAHQTLAMIQRNIESQSRLLDELMDFVSVGQRKMRLRPEPVDAHQAVLSAVEICQGEMVAAEVDVELDLEASSYRVLADAAKLQQILWNLMRNAVKFSPPGTSILITSRNDLPATFAVEIADTGAGIEPALLPLIFDAFQQGDSFAQQRFGGLGLGMFIAKSLAEAQLGTLSVDSEGRGKGATFRLTLPLHQGPT